MFSFFKSQMTIPEFWDRFVKIQGPIKQAIEKADPQEAFNLFNALILQFDDRLAFQIGYSEDGELSEIEISPDGHKDLFRKVIDLVEHAPKFPDFSIRAFKQRVDEAPTVQLNESIHVSEDALQYTFDIQVNQLNLDIWFDVPADVPEDVLYQLTNIFLDCALGEYDAVVFIGSVDVHHGRSEKAKPWSTLRDNFDQWLEKTHPRQ